MSAMKVIDIWRKHARELLTAFFAVAVFLFWLLCLPFLMVAREQSQLFLWNTDYLFERLALPGGLAQYLGEFIVQFFANPIYGACMYALLFVTVQLLTWRILRSIVKNQLSIIHYLLSFIPACLLWYMACNPNIPMTLIVAVLLVLALIAFLPKKSLARQVVLFVMVPVGYWLLGPAVVLLALVPLLLEPQQKTKYALFKSIDILLLLVFCVLASSRIAPYPLRQIARGIDYYWEGNKVGTMEEMKYDMLMRQRNWPKMAAMFEDKHVESLAIQNSVRLALYNLQRIGQEELLEGMSLSNQNLKSVSSAFLTSEIGLHIGMANIAQRSAFEAMEAIPNYNKSGRALRRLVETNIITGQYDVAKKYIALLEQTFAYRSWALKMKPLAEHPEQIKNHSFYHRLKDVYDHGKDVFFY